MKASIKMERFWDGDVHEKSEKGYINMGGPE